MTRLIRFAATALALAALAGCSNNRPEPTPLEDIAEPLTIEEVWDRDIGGGTDDRSRSLVVTRRAERVYAAGADGEVWAMKAADGEEVWHAELDAQLGGGPGVGEGLVLVGTIEGKVIALDEDNGKRVWSTQLTSEVLAVPRAARGVVVARTLDGQVHGLSATDGSRRWLYSASVPSLTLRGTGSPLLTDDMAVVGFDNGKVAALSLFDGSAVWQRTVGVPSGRSEVERLADVDMQPVREGDKVYAASYQGRVVEMSLESGTILWSHDISSYAGLAADVTGVYVSDARSRVVGLDRYTGAVAWEQKALERRRLSAPTVHGDAVVVGDYDGWLHWLSTSDGSIIGRVRIDSAPIASAPVSDGQRIYAVSSDGELSCLVVRE